MVTQTKLTPEELEAQAAEKGVTADELQAELENNARTALTERATAEGKTVEELLVEEEELAGLINKYDGDPLKMAKALKSSAQEATRISERQKQLERERESFETRLADITKFASKPDEGKDPLEAMKGAYRNRYPTLDDDVIDAMVDANIEMAHILRQEYALDKANSNIILEMESIKDNFYYKRFREEVDKLIEQQPLQNKLQKGMVRRCLDLIIGQHAPELISEAKENKEPSIETEIVGQIKGPKAKSTGTSQTGTIKLTSRQAVQASEMGIKPETYIAILKNRREKAKANGLPEPELITEPVEKKK